MNVGDLLARARFNANQKKELEQLVDDITRRERISEEALLETLVDMLDSDRSPGQKADAALDDLRSRRHPEYSRRMEALRMMKKKLGLNRAGVSVEPPPYFEGERLEFRFAAGTPEELARAAQALAEAARSDDASRLFEPLK